MTVPNNENNSDESSDSSWTLINEPEVVEEKEILANSTGEIDTDKPTKEMLEEPLEVADKKKNINVNVKSIKQKHNKRKKSGNNKKGMDYMHFASIVACLLTIAGITLLTTLLPPNYAESADIEDMQHHLADVYERMKNPSMENSISSIQSAISAIEATKASNAFNIVAQNISDEQTCDAMPPEYSDSSMIPKDISKVRIKIIAPYNEEIFTNNSTLNEPNDINEMVQNRTMSLVDNLEDLVKSPTLQLLVATLVQDLCLIKLIKEFSKRTREESAKNMKQVQQKTKVNSSKSDAAQKKNKKSKAAIPSAIEPSVRQDETGKSECQRRFEELDSKWSTLGQHHRHKVQEIKNKFQEEIFRINDIEKEGLNRKQKIRFTREKYIQKLKTNREIYLHRLRKLREERQVILKNVCHNFKNSRNLSQKDVSVGNFAILLSNDYDFPKKLDKLEAKARSKSNGKLQVINTEPINYTPDNNYSTTSNNNTPNISNDKRTNKKPPTDKNAPVQEVKEVIMNILDSLPEAKSENNTSQVFPANEEPFQLVRRRKTSKKNLNELYDAAFDDQSKKIKEQDTIKWNKKFESFKWTTPVELMIKQDPQKTHRKKVIYKGLL